MVHELQANMPSIIQQLAADALSHLAASSDQNQAVIAAAGAIPPLVQLLASASTEYVRATAVGVLRQLTCNHPENQATIIADGAIPALEHLLTSDSPDVREAAAGALSELGAGP
ncbi:hypothetical protein FOA52_009642 [Chlamydomonas sp. UWO 241]|nr:hypothetical protein FOA52_009642 [Chlamydomonas sp. UWO 241]